MHIPHDTRLSWRALHLREIAIALFSLVAIFELGSALAVVTGGPVRWESSVVSVSARHAAKAFAIAALTSSVVVGLVAPRWSSMTRAQVGRLTGFVAGAAVLIGMAALAGPYLVPGFVMGHDGGVHQTYVFLFNRALRQGQFPVRWVEGAGHGLGQPLFNYYQVGFYYLVSLVHAIGPPLSAAFKTVVIGQWMLGGVGLYLLCRPWGQMPALLAAALFVWAPYLLLDVYVRTAYPELTAIGFAPAVLLSIDRVLRTGSLRWVAGLAMATALLLISHLPAALIFAPVAALFGLASGWSQRVHARRYGLLAVGALLGAGLAAFYAAPAILELSRVKIRHLTAGYFDYHQHFVPPRWWFDYTWAYGGSGDAANRMSVQIGLAQWIVLTCAVVVLAVPALRRRLRVPVPLVATAVATVALALFMMTAASARIWEHIAPLAFVQFPWRLLMVPAVLCALIGAALLTTIRQVTVQALVVICAVSFQWHVTRTYRGMAWRQGREAMALDDARWLDSPDGKRIAFREPSYDWVRVTEKPVVLPERWSLPPEASTTSVQLLRNEDAHVVMEVRTPEAVSLVVNTPRFPGWRVTIDGQDTAPAVQPKTGYMEVAVPAGTHRVEARFTRDRIRLLAESISVIATIVWGVCLWIGRRHP